MTMKKFPRLDPLMPAHPEVVQGSPPKAAFSVGIESPERQFVVERAAEAVPYHRATLGQRARWARKVDGGDTWSVWVCVGEDPPPQHMLDANVVEVVVQDMVGAQHVVLSCRRAAPRDLPAEWLLTLA